MTEHTEHLIEEHWAPCGIEDDLRRELLEKQSHELKEGRKWKPELAQLSVKKATKQALGLAEKWRKPECHYLNMALRNKWVSNWYQSMVG